MRGPGYLRDPAHTVAVEASTHVWVAVRDGQELARSGSAFELREAGYPPVIYFPRAAVNLDVFATSDASSYCPFKGEASYLAIDGVDVAWSYPTPYDEVRDIAGCVAFYPQQVVVRKA